MSRFVREKLDSIFESARKVFEFFPYKPCKNSVSDPSLVYIVDDASRQSDAGDDDAAGPATRFVVVGNTTAGQHHLLIRYTVFPDDAGLWTCASLSDGRLVHHTQLTVLVPPPTQVVAIVVVGIPDSHISPYDKSYVI